MRSPIDDIKQKQQYLSEEDLPKIYHDFMVAYGYIDYSIFKEIPISRILKLYKYINEDKKAEQEYRKLQLKGLGYKIK